MIKLIIADSSKLVRETLKGFLKDIPYLEILGESDNGIDLVNLVKKLHPNVLFIDIEMPEMNGLEAAQIIRAMSPSMIIVFIASNERYNKEAFDMYAYDYILKPLKQQRILQTLNRIINFEKHKLRLSSSDILPKAPKANTRLLIECDGKSSIINVQDIIFITRHDRKAIIVCKNRKISAWISIENIEKKLPEYFFRCHKGFIVNVDMISEIVPCGKKTYCVYFQASTETALMTIEKAKILKERYCI